MIAFLDLIGQERTLDDDMSSRHILVEFFERRSDRLGWDLQRGAERLEIISCQFSLSAIERQGHFFFIVRHGQMSAYLIVGGG